MEYFKVLSSDNRELTTDEILHPGDVLDMELAARGIKKNFAATQLGLSPSNLSDLLKQKRHVGATLAIKLETFLGISAEYWLRVQSGYDLAKARQQMSEAA